MLDAPGPYPERLHTFRDAGHHLWWISTLLLPPTGQVAGVNACHLWDLARAPEEAVERLVELIATERIDAVYSLLNVWSAERLLFGCIPYGQQDSPRRARIETSY